MGQKILEESEKGVMNGNSFFSFILTDWKENLATKENQSRKPYTFVKKFFHQCKMPGKYHT
jgi:hypothetical protein